MSLEDLAYFMAEQYGPSRLGDRMTFGDWLWGCDLPCDESAIDDFERAYSAALEELRMGQ